MAIEYNGRKEFKRPRKLSETSVNSYVNDLQSTEDTEVDERQKAIDTIFSKLTKTYLKGNVLKKALSEMSPAQFIPIESDAELTSASAIRLAKENSNQGKIITYSLFQKSVDIILKKKWEIKGEVFNGSIPASKESVVKHTSGVLSAGDDAFDLIKDFIAQNGIVSTLIGVLTMSPFQAPIFSALQVEKGAQGVQAAQIAPGLVLFLELGLKVEQILQVLKGANIDIPGIDNTLYSLSSSDEARAEALASVGVDYNSLKKGQEFQDAETIVKYTNDYYTRYGGLDREGGHLTIDHWVAYMQVAQNNQTVRSALNTAPTFSPKFKIIQKRYSSSNVTETSSVFQDTSENRDKGLDTASMFNQFGSTARLLQETSDTVYSDIIAAFSYRLTDKDLCCLVQIFGKIGNTDLMLNIAVILRILAISLSGMIARIQSLVAAMMAHLAQDVLFDAVAKLNEYYSKIVSKILKVFTVDIEHLTACKGMFSLGWALIESVNVMFTQVFNLLKDINKIILDFAGKGIDIEISSPWSVAAERKNLLGIARLLEVIAKRMQRANLCDLGDTLTTSDTLIETDPNQQVDIALLSILEEVPPVLSIPEEDLIKYFPDEPTFTSSRLKFDYGIKSVQNNETEEQDCSYEESQQKLDKLFESLKSAFETSFNG
jgi:hypothetical protein